MLRGCRYSGPSSGHQPPEFSVEFDQGAFRNRHGVTLKSTNKSVEGLLVFDRCRTLGQAVMTVIPLTRCQFVMPFVDIHLEIGGRLVISRQKPKDPHWKSGVAARCSISLRCENDACREGGSEFSPFLPATQRLVPTKCRATDSVNFTIEGQPDGKYSFDALPIPHSLR